MKSYKFWTQRGAARHAKMLETDAAWAVFEKLEDCYFGMQEAMATGHITAAQRQQLHELADLVVASGKQTYPETWARFRRKFKIPKYEMLPASRFDEAYVYLRGNLWARYSLSNFHRTRRKNHVDHHHSVTTTKGFPVQN